VDGAVGTLSRWLLPRYVGFSDQLPPVERLAESAERIDHRVLNRLDLNDFVAVARELVAALPDSVIESSVTALPRPYIELEHDRLVRALKARRDRLPKYAEDYYRLLARTLHVYGADPARDVVVFEPVDKGLVRIRVRTAGHPGPPRFERIVDARDTRVVKLFLDPVLDQVIGAADLRFKVVIAPPR
jgi:hypothetical protein